MIDTSKIHICVNSSDTTHSVDRTIPLAEKGFKISFIAHTIFDGIEKLQIFSNIDIYILSDFEPNKKYFRGKIYLRLIKELNPDLIIVHFCGYDRFHTAIFSGIKPIVGVLMAGEVDITNTTVQLYVWLVFKFTNLFIPYLELLASKTKRIIRLLDKRNLKGKIVHIPWGVKINKKQIDESRKSYQINFDVPNDKLLILSNRNVSKEGRQLEIVKAFHNLLKIRNDIHLIIVKRTEIKEYWEIIEKYIIENNISQFITITEYIPQTEMFNLYWKCDVMISNWIHDGMPQSFFEASLRRLPIIMNKLEQYEDYYEDKISCLFNDGTTNGIYNNLKEILENDTLRESISDNAFESIIAKANFDDWAEIFIKELYELIVTRKVIKIPYLKLISGKLLLALILITKRFPFNKIMIKV